VGIRDELSSSAARASINIEINGILRTGYNGVSLTNNAQYYSLELNAFPATFLEPCKHWSAGEETITD
jgi:hypothetical protein